MTVSKITANDRYADAQPAAGAITADFDFPIDDDSELQVLRVRAGVTEPLVLAVDYSVAISGDLGGVVTFTAPTLDGDDYHMLGATPDKRISDYQFQGQFSSESVDADLNQILKSTQEIRRDQARSIMAPAGEAGHALPARADLAGKLLTGNALTGALEVGPSTADISGQAATAATARDEAVAARDVTTAARDTTTAARDQAVAANDNVIIKAGEVDAHHTATLSARDAALVAQGLVDTAQAATEAARDVSTGARDTAITKAAEASTSANAASTALTAAEAARDATLASLNNFLDVYLGGFAVAPTTDLDGSPLEAGDLYYNTVSEGMFVYTGTQWVAAYVSGTGGLQAANNLSDLASVGQALINLGLGSVNNTSDADKPVSNLTQAALNLKADTAATLLKSANLAGLADLAVARANLGLGNVNNTADADKPVSTAQQTAINGREPANSALLKSDATAALGVGYTATVHDLGAITGGTVKPDPANGNFQKMVNNGAHIFAAPDAVGCCAITLLVTNGASPGSVTESGFTKSSGDDFTAVNGDDFLLYITKIDGFTSILKEALQ